MPFPDGPLLRFIFSSPALAQLLLPYIEDRKLAYGCFPRDGLKDPASPGSGAKRVIVEFSSPNIGPEFNGNHLRSTLLGAFVSNMYQRMGWDVTRLSYLGDWGKELALLAVGFKQFGSEEKLQQEPLRHIVDVYTQIKAASKPQQDEIRRAKDEQRSVADIENTGILADRDKFFKSLEDGDEEAVALWKRFRDLSIERLVASYDRFGIRFDEHSGESEVKPETMTEVESKLKENGVLQENEDGSWVVDFEQHGGKTAKGLGSQALRDRNGSTTYLLRDIAAVLDRERTYSFDKMVYVVSLRQSTHFQQVLLGLRLMGRGELEDKIQHFGFGEVQGLSTVVQGPLLLDTILDECGRFIPESVSGADESSSARDAAVVNALLFEEMNSKKHSHGYTFDPKPLLAPEGEAADDLTLQQIFAKLTEQIAELNTDEVKSATAEYDALQDADVAELLAMLPKYPEITATTFKSLEPHTILAYLSQLAAAIEALISPDDDDDDDAADEGGESQAVEEPHVQEVPKPGEKKAMLQLYRCTAQVLHNGMRLLGFTVVGSGVTWD